MQVTSDRSDALLESINISFGLAASLIGDILEEYVQLQIPKISTIPIHKLHETILKSVGNSDAFYATKQRFFGNFGGEVVFAFSENSAKSFAALLLDEKEISSDETEGALLELSNILTTACIGQLSQIVEGESLFGVPNIRHINKKEVSVLSETLEYDNAIVITAALNVAEQNIQGYMFILLSDSMLEKLFDMLDESSL